MNRWLISVLGMYCLTGCSDHMVVDGRCITCINNPVSGKPINYGDPSQREGQESKTAGSDKVDEDKAIKVKRVTKNDISKTNTQPGKQNSPSTKGTRRSLVPGSKINKAVNPNEASTFDQTVDMESEQAAFWEHPMGGEIAFNTWIRRPKRIVKMLTREFGLKIVEYRLGSLYRMTELAPRGEGRPHRLEVIVMHKVGSVLTNVIIRYLVLDNALDPEKYGIKLKNRAKKALGVFDMERVG